MYDLPKKVLCETEKKSSMAVEIDNLIVIAGRCDPQRCRKFCSRRVSLEAQHDICDKFWERHQSMETRHEHLDKIVVSKQVAR